MAKVTSKLQVTIPKAIARQYRIEPGDVIDFKPAGPQIRIVLGDCPGEASLSRAERLRLFDGATERQRQRERHMKLPATPPSDRGWTREELYTRGEAD